MAMPRNPNRRLIRGFSLHPTIIALVDEEARRRNVSRSRAAEEALARHYGLGIGYAIADRGTTTGQAAS